MGCSSISGYVSDRMIFPGLNIGSLNELSGGFIRMRYITSVEAACSGSYKFPNQVCSLAIQTKDYTKSSSYKVKLARKGGSGFYPLMPRTTCVKKGMEVQTLDEEEFADIKEGDIINLWDLIFSKDRDYLVRYNDQQIKAKQLVGKAILVYFLPVSYDLYFDQENWITYLIDIYNDLLPNNDFEVILVAVDNPSDLATPGRYRTKPHEVFDSIFSRVPWTAIPFSDLASRKRIARRFGISEIGFFCSTSVLLDAKGMVLKCIDCWVFGRYGTLGYPFTDERIKFLDSEDDAAINQPSLESLLGSPERDYLITNNGDKVPIHTLKNKVVALYFFEDGLSDDGHSSLIDEELRIKLEMACKELARNKEQFEIPLSQFAGKRLIIYFEMHKYYPHCEKLRMMKDLYLKMKGTDDEFEVIYIKDPSSYDEPDVSYPVHEYGELIYIKDPSSYDEPDVSYPVHDYGELPWPVHYYGEGYSLPKELEHSVLDYHYGTPTMTFRRCLLIAFDRDGSIVRKSFHPSFDDKVFPFYAGGLEKEFLYLLNIRYGWNYWNNLSKKKNPIYKRAQ